MKLAELDGEALEAADEILDVAAHDVAKYMAMTARNVDPASIPEDLGGRLLEEVTRVDGERPAWALWGTFSKKLAALADDEELRLVDEQMEDLRALSSGDEAGEGRDLGAIARLAADTAQRITALRRAVRRRLIAVGR